MNAIDIGKRIKEVRSETGKTLQDIASEIGVARSTIQRYENGTINNAKLPVIEAIARSVGVNPVWLLGKSDKKYAEKEKPTEEIQWGDFSYALYKESPDLTQEDRDEILDVVRLMVQKKKERQQKEKSSE